MQHEWTGRPSQAFACACEHTALLLIGLVRERNPPFQPRPSSTGYGAALSIPNSSISSLWPNLLDSLLWHSLAWSLPLPLLFETPIFLPFVFVFLHPPSSSYSISVTLLCFSSLCVFSTNVLCLILICTHFCLFSPSDSSIPHLSLPFPVSVNLWLHFHFLCWLHVILSSWRDQLPLIAFGEQ